jgi:hypothetical protein
MIKLGLHDQEIVFLFRAGQEYIYNSKFTKKISFPSFYLCSYLYIFIYINIFDHEEFDIIASF